MPASTGGIGVTVTRVAVAVSRRAGTPSRDPSRSFPRPTRHSCRSSSRWPSRDGTDRTDSDWHTQHRRPRLRRWDIDSGCDWHTQHRRPRLRRWDIDSGSDWHTQRRRPRHPRSTGPTGCDWHTRAGGGGTRGRRARLVAIGRTRSGRGGTRGRRARLVAIGRTRSGRGGARIRIRGTGVAIAAPAVLPPDGRVPELAWLAEEERLPVWDRVPCCGWPLV